MPYSKYVQYNKLISPKNGYSCKSISKQNIFNFGFNNIQHLHVEYPDFPLSCQKKLDDNLKASLVAQEKHKILKKERIVQYNLAPNRCLFCHIEFDYNNRQKKFCSNSCSAKCNNNHRKSRSTLSRNKTSNSMKLYAAMNPEKIIEHRMKLQEKRQIKKYECVICHAQISIKKKTCGPICFRLLAQKNACSQVSHGGGHKGWYKGIYCDSSWELALVVTALDFGIHIERANEFRSYTYEGKSCKYIPDFKIEGNIYEVKGFMSKRAEAKLAQNSDVMLIPRDVIKDCIKYVKTAYDVCNIVDLYL